MGSYDVRGIAYLTAFRNRKLNRRLPVFLMPPKPLTQVHTVGNHEHVVFQIEAQGRTLSGVGFNLAREALVKYFQHVIRQQ